jgi:hypothetical protein
LFEDDLAALPVCLDYIASFPRHLVIRVLSGSGVKAFDGEAFVLRFGRRSIDDRV